MDYNFRNITDNDYWYIYELKKNAYRKYVEANFGAWDEVVQRKHFKRFFETYKENTYIVQTNGKDIGFYNDCFKENGNYEIGNICIIPQYQGMGLGTKILKDIINKYRDYNIKIQYFKQNPVGNLYKRLGFEQVGETEYHYQMIKYHE